MKVKQFIHNCFYGKPTCEDKTSKPKQPTTETPQLTMKELIIKIATTTKPIMDDLGKFAAGNKTAGQRARKASVELEKLYKEFRKRSVHENVEQD